MGTAEPPADHAMKGRKGNQFPPMAKRWPKDLVFIVRYEASELIDDAILSILIVALGDFHEEDIHLVDPGDSQLRIGCL